jgi:hypothetical protein
MRAGRSWPDVQDLDLTNPSSAVKTTTAHGNIKGTFSVLGVLESQLAVKRVEGVLFCLSFFLVVTQAFHDNLSKNRPKRSPIWGPPAPPERLNGY